MKLPLDGETGQGATPSNNHSEERESERAEGSSENNVQANGGPAANGTPTPGGGEPDFSEYLWMEHEEEFDEQVLKELEDEEMINYYFELYEASMEEEANKRRGPPAHQNGLAGRSGPPNLPPGCSVGITDSASYPGGRPAYRNRDDVDQITRGLDRVNFSSRLNPDAAEFVPRGGQSVSTSSGSDSRPPPDTQPC